jgi:hypothetical protein
MLLTGAAAKLGLQLITQPAGKQQPTTQLQVPFGQQVADSRQQGRVDMVLAGAAAKPRLQLIIQ